jgi:CBS domain containing-hemolysin-like protein
MPMSQRLLLATAVQMVLGELVPKNIALSRPAESVVWLVIPLVVFTKLTRPLIAVLNGLANQLLRLVGVEPVEELRSARTPDELASVVRRAGVQGALGSETAVLMERSLTFGAKTAADVMTSRTRVRTVSASAPVATVIEATRDTGHSRFPVIGDSVDDIRGVIHVKRAVAVPEADRTTRRIRDVMTAPVLVPPSIALDPLHDRLQQRGLQLAVVVDEYGGTARRVLASVRAATARRDPSRYRSRAASRTRRLRDAGRAHSAAAPPNPRPRRPGRRARAPPSEWTGLTVAASPGCKS